MRPLPAASQLAEQTGLALCALVCSAYQTIIISAASLAGRYPWVVAESLPILQYRRSVSLVPNALLEPPIILDIRPETFFPAVRTPHDSRASIFDPATIFPRTTFAEVRQSAAPGCPTSSYLIFDRLRFDVIDHQNLRRPLGLLQLEAKLLFDSFEK
jgi:hypothetical protein